MRNLRKKTPLGPSVDALPNTLPIAVDHQHGDADIVNAVAIAVGERKMSIVDRRLLAIFFIVLLAFAALSANTQRNNGTLKVQQQQLRASNAVSDQRFQTALAGAYASCVSGKAFVDRYNRAQDELEQIAAEATTTSPELQRRRVQAYQDAKVPNASCDYLKPPPPPKR